MKKTGFSRSFSIRQSQNINGDVRLSFQGPLLGQALLQVQVLVLVLRHAAAVAELVQHAAVVERVQHYAVAVAV